MKPESEKSPPNLVARTGIEPVCDAPEIETIVADQQDRICELFPDSAPAFGNRPQTVPTSRRFLSVCSGIEAASVAWHPLGWRAAGVAEIEPFPCAVLNHHYPTVPNFGDLTQHHTWKLNESIDLLVGGTPCQAFSVAGLRKGLADPRGNLTLVFLGLVAQLRPRWIVWENVPGVLSDKTGAFGSFLGGLGQLGYGCAYRILDAQYFGVAQRRRRVFVVGHLGGLWQRAAAVLLERESLCGNPPPRRHSGKGTATTLSARTKGGGGLGTDFDLDGGTIPVGIDGGELAFALRANASHSGDKGDGGVNTTMVAECAPCLTGNYGKQPDNSDTSAGPMLVPEIAYALQERDSKGSDSNTKDGHLIPVSSPYAFPQNLSGTQCAATPDRCPSLASSNPTAVASGMSVRRLTPRECERLQGFPDDYTAIPYRGKSAADCPAGPRYKALGNSMAVPVMRWIGQRIDLVDQLVPL